MTGYSGDKILLKINQTVFLMNIHFMVKNETDKTRIKQKLLLIFTINSSFYFRFFTF